MGLTGLFFLVFVLAGVWMAFFRGPIYGLYLYVAVFYLDPVNRWWGASLPDLRWSLLSAAVTLLATLVRANGQPRASVFSQTPIVLFLVYIAWMWIRTPWAVDPEANWFELIIYTKYLLVIYLVYRLVDSREHVAGFLAVHSFGCLYLGVQAWLVGGGDRLDGIGGPGINDSNSMAMQFATGAFAAAAYYFAEKRRRRFLMVIVLPFVLNGVVLSGSRGGFLAVLAGGLVFFIFRPAGQLRAVLPYALLGLALLGYVASSAFIERMSSLTKPVAEQASDDLSVESRLELFKAQWRMVLDHPFGAGNGGTAALSRGYMEEIYMARDARGVRINRASHNTIMSALVSLGFAGAILWLAIVLTFWTRLRTNQRACNAVGDRVAGWLNAGIAGMFAVVFVAGMFSPQERTEVFVWILGLGCAFVHFADRKARSQVSAVGPDHAFR